MTNQQAKLCKLIRKCESLSQILANSQYENLGEIEELLYPYVLDCTDTEDGTDTKIELPREALIDLENRERDAITRGIAICALVISIIALFR